MNRDDELSRIFKAGIKQWQWDAKPTENNARPTGDFDIRKVLRELGQTIHIEGTFDYSAPPPEGASWSFGSHIAPSSAKVVEGSIIELGDATNAEAKEQDEH